MHPHSSMKRVDNLEAANSWWWTHWICYHRYNHFHVAVRTPVLLSVNRPIATAVYDGSVTRSRTLGLCNCHFYSIRSRLSQDTQQDVRAPWSTSNLFTINHHQPWLTTNHHSLRSLSVCSALRRPRHREDQGRLFSNSPRHVILQQRRSTVVAQANNCYKTKAWYRNDDRLML